MGARTTALAALIACRKQGAWADGVLKKYVARDGLDRRDAALASRLCYGVLQNRMLLDYYIQLCLKGSIGKLQPVVLDILRIGMYQIFMMDRIPVSAAVNEAVEQGKKYANRSAAGLINGVLRHAVREKEQFPLPENPAVRYSHPEELVALLREQVCVDELDALLMSHNQAPETVIQLNPLYSEHDTVIEKLQTSGASVMPHPWLEDAWYLSGGGDIEKLPTFSEGGFLVQDPAAKLAVMAAGLEPGMNVLDGCAAPGGKSFAAAFAMKNRGSIISCDIHEHKIKLLSNGAERLHIQIMKPTLQDGSVCCAKWEKSMDVVIADVPCSGLGVIRKKPDIRYKDLNALAKLPEVQQRILDNLSGYVHPGGVLIYSTCTILKRENEEVVYRFLETHPDFQLEPFPVPDKLPKGENCGMLTLLPHVHETDGFFICKLRRK